MNLLYETKAVLGRYGKLPEDVKWVGRPSTNAVCSWGEFATQADIDYDNGYGGQEIPSDLVVVGSDWWLERAEYDGAEWWEYKKFPAKWACETADLGLKLDKLRWKL